MNIELFKFLQTAGLADVVDEAIYNTFDEFQLSLSEEEFLHPSEECHRQIWLGSDSKIFDIINSYHAFCKLCKKHFYSRSVPTDINSFFQGHINTEYHREFRNSQLSRFKEMFTWEKKWVSGRCNVCQMPGLVAFVRDMECSLTELISQHHCVWMFVMQENNQEFLRKMSLLKKYCKLSIFKEKFIRPLDEGSACMLCCSKIPWTGENVKIHLGSQPHLIQFSGLIWSQHRIPPKDLLNGFNLEKITRWIYSCVFRLPENLQFDYEGRRLECSILSVDSLFLDMSPKRGHYCPELVEKWLTRFTNEGKCLLCNQFVTEALHFWSQEHQAKLRNLPKDFSKNVNNYGCYFLNQLDRFQPDVETIEKYRELKEGRNYLRLKVEMRGYQQTFRRRFVAKLALVKKSSPKSPNQNSYFCETCDVRVPASLLPIHLTELRHGYHIKKWEELEKSTADDRFFDTFQKTKNYIICLLCGAFIQTSSFFSHIKGSLHTKRFQWYCTLKNEVPICSALEVLPNLSVVCYICDSVLPKGMSVGGFKMNPNEIRKHWPCPLLVEQGAETKDSFAEVVKGVESPCAACGGDRGAHTTDCSTNCLNFQVIENDTEKILETYENKMFQKVLSRTKSVIRSSIEAAANAAAEGRRGGETAACRCEKPRSQCTCELAPRDSAEEEAVETGEGAVKTKQLRNNEVDAKKLNLRAENEEEQEVLVISESMFPAMPSDLLTLLEQPTVLLVFVANIAKAAAAAMESLVEFQREKSVCATINNAVVDLFPNCRCYPFGSRLTGLMFNSSDLDVFLDRGGMYEGVQNESPAAARRRIHQVAKALRKQREVSHLVIIDRARVPIISFLHKPTGLHCDLSFKNALSVHNTLLIKSLVSVDVKVKLVILFLKYWAKQTGVHGRQFFSSYAITMMAIFYLQQLNPPLVPTVEELQKAFVGRRLTIGGWDCSFSENVKLPVVEGRYDFPLEVILKGFFTYYANFDYVNLVISPLSGRPFLREAFSSESPVRLPMCYKRHILNFPLPLEKLVSPKIPICVIDPFDLSHVLTKSFTQTGLETFKLLCQLSAKALHKATSETPAGRC